MEQQCRSDVEQIYNHTHLERHEPLVQLLDEDLFATQTWLLFGLTQQQLITTGALGGAATGGVIDLAVGGASLFLGAGIGAMIGGVSAWVTTDRIADIKILGLPLGGKQLSIGPMRNINFPYVVLGRALYHHSDDRRPHPCPPWPAGTETAAGLAADGRYRPPQAAREDLRQTPQAGNAKP